MKRDEGSEGDVTAPRTCLLYTSVFMLIGENSRAVSQAVSARIDAINKTLPAGVQAVTVYDLSLIHICAADGRGR